MMLHFLCTLLFLTTIGCYSVNEEEVEADEPPNSAHLEAATSKHEKALKLSLVKAAQVSNHEESSPYNDETPIKAIKYKNYGYFNPSVATLKLSRQAAVPKSAALTAGTAAFQFSPDRNLVARMTQNGSLDRPVFHFQRRLDESQYELEEDRVNLKVRPNQYSPDHRSLKPNYFNTFNTTRVLTLRPSPQQYTSRRYYQRSFVAAEPLKSQSPLKEVKSTETAQGNDVDFESLSSSVSADENFGKLVAKGKQVVDSEREALTGSQREFADISSESEESNRAVAADVDLDREYRKLPRGRFARRKVERSLADPEVVADGGPNGFFIPTPIPGFLYPKSEEVESPVTEVTKKDESPEKRKGSSTESVSHSTYFLPTRPAGGSDEVQSITDGLSSFYTVSTDTSSSKRPPIVFVTAPVENGPSGPDLATVEEEINEKKNFSIEDFYNAFSANVTEYPNRHRDPDEGSSVTTAVNAASGSFLAFAPHFPLSPASDLQSRAIKYPCTCDKGKCGCCTGRIMSNFNINIPARGCLNITYIPEDFEFMVKMTYNDRTLAQRRVSGKNPRPMCVPLPRLTGRAQACVKLSNVYLVGRNVHMCLDLEARVQNDELFKVSFDCVRMGTSGIKWIKPEDGGGLGPPPVVEGPAPDDYDAVVASEGDEITDAKENMKRKRPSAAKGTSSTKGTNSTKDGSFSQNSLDSRKSPVKDVKRQFNQTEHIVNVTESVANNSTKKSDSVTKFSKPVNLSNPVEVTDRNTKPAKGVKDGKHRTGPKGSRGKDDDDDDEYDDDY